MYNHLFPIDVSSPEFATDGLTTDAQKLMNFQPVVESKSVVKGVWNKIAEIEQKLKGGIAPVVQTIPIPNKRNFRKGILGF